MIKYVSIDIETTGLDPEKHQILEFAAVFENGGELWELPCFHCFILNDPIQGSAYALNMNQRILKILAERPEGYNYYSPREMVHQFRGWLNKYGYAKRIIIAGKNFANFDLRFLRRIENWCLIDHCHRFLDPGSMYWTPQDSSVPDTLECMKRAGLTPGITHRAIDDARLVIDLIRRSGK